METELEWAALETMGLGNGDIAIMVIPRNSCNSHKFLDEDSNKNRKIRGDVERIWQILDRWNKRQEINLIPWSPRDTLMEKYPLYKLKSQV